MTTVNASVDNGHGRAAVAAVADLIDYPGAAAAAMARRVLESPPAWLAQASPELQDLMRAFAQAVLALPRGRWEEIYTETFDLQPDLTLNLGHQLFGENWKRSSLLIELQALMPRYGVNCGTELPDHLAPLLRLLAAAPSADAEVRELRAECIRPALRTLSGKLAADHPYTPLLQALTLLLTQPEARP